MICLNTININENNKMKILVIGGTGTIGKELVSLLKKNDADYSVLVRKKEKAEELRSSGIPTVVGSLGEWSTIEHAFEGVDTIFLLTSPAPEMLDLHKRVIDMAVKTGVRKIVRSSAEPASYSDGMPLYEQHAAADKYLEQSGLKYVILRPHYFMQNIQIMHTEFIKSKSMFAQYLGDTRIPMIDVRDIAKAAFFALTKDDFNNQTYVLTGPRSISFTDVAKALSNVLDRDIKYVSLSYDEQKAGLKSMGVPEWTSNTVMKLFKIWEEKGENEVSNDFEKITNTKAIDIEEYAKDYVEIFK